MAGLVSYISSDEEGENDEQSHQDEVMTTEDAAPPRSEGRDAGDDVSTKPSTIEPPSSPKSAPQIQLEPPPVAVGPAPQSAAPMGPSLPPMEAPVPDDGDPITAAAQTPTSPYSANRATIQDLTLPAVPNLDIPPSPPGSPPSGANKKFEQFLDLKKKGVHFNSKLEQSTALRNPGLMDKLLAFVEVEGAAQYDTTLPPDLWDPKAFPQWAFRQRLRKSREKVAKEREAERASGSRTAVDFVPSTGTTGGGSAAGEGSVARGEKRKGGWK